MEGWMEGRKEERKKGRMKGRKEGRKKHVMKSVCMCTGVYACVCVFSLSISMQSTNTMQHTLLERPLHPLHQPSTFLFISSYFTEGYFYNTFSHILFYIVLFISFISSFFIFHIHFNQ